MNDFIILHMDGAASLFNVQYIKSITGSFIEFSNGEVRRVDEEMDDICMLLSGSCNITGESHEDIAVETKSEQGAA